MRQFKIPAPKKERGPAGAGIRNGISAVLIVKNEEKVLDRCLKSIDLVDEIVVLDTGSTDQTLSIAKKYTSRVFQAPPMEPFHFGNARNQALSHARHDWILTIDADEIARPECIPAIRKAVWNHPRASGFNVKFIISSDGGENEASLPKLKVFRRASWEWLYRIHEILSPRRLPALVEELPEAVLEHLPVAEADKAERREQNLKLLELSVQESPEYVRNARQLGMEHFAREEYRKAIPWLEMYLQSGTGGPLDRSETLVHLGRAKAKVGLQEEAIADFDLALAEAPIRREIYYHKALVLITGARPDLAIPVLEKGLSIPVSEKPDFHLNVDRVWDGSYLQEALDFCRKTVEEHEKAKG